jgi:hypothetical protein
MDQLKGLGEPTATNAPIGRFIHWMGYIFPFNIRWIHHSPFFFIVGHYFILFWVFS